MAAAGPFQHLLVIKDLMWLIQRVQVFSIAKIALMSTVTGCSVDFSRLVEIVMINSVFLYRLIGKADRHPVEDNLVSVDLKTFAGVVIRSYVVRQVYHET